MKIYSAIIIFLIMVIYLSGCGRVEELTTGQTTEPLSSITISPSNVSLAKSSDHYQFTATGKDKYGGSVHITPTWTASSEIGTTNQNGTLTISSNSGIGTIKAYVGTIEGVANVTVTSGTLKSIIVSPSGLQSIFVGMIRQFSASGVDSNGSSVSLDPFWSLDPIDVGTISQDGLFVPISEGSSGYIVVSQASETASVEVNILTSPSP